MTPRLTIVSVATHPGHPAVADLAANCRQYRHVLVLAGAGHDYEDHAAKARILADILPALRGPVVLLDAYDTLVLSPPEDLLERWRQLGGGVVFEAEKNCWPDGSLADQFPDAGPWRYPNCGVIMGEAAALAEIYQTVGAADWSGNDQGHFARLYAQARLPGATLDTGCVVSQSLYLLARGDLDLAAPGVVRNVVTGSTPVILHGNGGVAMGPWRAWHAGGPPPEV